MKIPRDLSGTLSRLFAAVGAIASFIKKAATSCWRLKNLLTNASLCLPTKTFASER
jgi:hypothetical protein